MSEPRDKPEDRGDPPEERLEDVLDDLVEGGVLEECPPGHFVVTRHINEFVDEGYWSTPCRYHAHRSSDWQTPEGYWMCGICHPDPRRGRPDA